jgi:hypothetical protein
VNICVHTLYYPRHEKSYKKITLRNFWGLRKHLTKDCILFKRYEKYYIPYTTPGTKKVIKNTSQLLGLKKKFDKIIAFDSNDMKNFKKYSML